MTKLTLIRNKLDKKLFNSSAVLRSTITITPITVDAGDFGGYSGQTQSEGTVDNAAGVPYNLFANRVNYQGFGNLNEGDMDCVFRYDVSINIGDKVTFNSVDYIVTQIKQIPVNDGVAAIIVRISKQH